jgi:hypothetical protein
MSHRYKIEPNKQKDYFNFKIYGIEKKWERSELRELIEKLDNAI